MPSKAQNSKNPVVRTQLVATGSSGKDAPTDAIDPHRPGSSGEIQVHDSPPRANIHGMVPRSAAGGGKKAEISGAQELKEVKEEVAERVISLDENVPELSPPKAPKPASRVSSLRGEGRGGSRKEVDEFGSPKTLPEVDPHSRGSSGESFNLVLRTPELRAYLPKTLLDLIDRTADIRLTPSRLAPVPLIHPAVEGHEAEPAVDPWRYLIDVDEDELDLRRYPHSVRTYIRLLGHTPDMEKRAFDSEQDKAEAELAEGWRVLKSAKKSQGGDAPRGIFFDPSKITAEAVNRFPLMPWIYGIQAEDVDDLAPQGVYAPWATCDDGGTTPTNLSTPYLRQSRFLVVSNAIVPLAECGLSSTEAQWDVLVTSCHSDAHPVSIIINNTYVNKDNSETLILAARDRAVPNYLFPHRDHNHGLFPDRDAAYRKYMMEVYGWFEG